MDYVRGKSLVEFLLAPAPGLRFLQALSQITLLLAYLEETIRFDHRDLKVDNIWIREDVPVAYSVPLGSLDQRATWKLVAPFQVVLLDFGFSCLGNEKGVAFVSLSEDVLPIQDRCPKMGRDLFQFLVSLWSIEPVRARQDPEIHAFIERLLSYKGTTFSTFMKKESFHWTYLTVSDPSFQYPPLHPSSVLEELVKIPALHEGFLTKPVAV
jgi:serine/threonine protein kinase